MNFHDPFGRASLPEAHFDRFTRVALLVEAADALVAGEPVPQPAASLLGKALQLWLSGAGELDRLLEIIAVPGSHVTVPALVRRLYRADPPFENSRRPRLGTSIRLLTRGAQDADISATLTP